MDLKSNSVHESKMIPKKEELKERLFTCKRKKYAQALLLLLFLL